MNIVASTEARIRDVKITSDAITAHLVDGRVVSVPLAWSWRLSEATPAQRRNFQIVGDGQGVHWPAIDEDISAEGMLHGVPAHRPRGVTRAGGAARQSHREPPDKRMRPTRAEARRHTRRRGARR